MSSTEKETNSAREINFDFFDSVRLKGNIMAAFDTPIGKKKRENELIWNDAAVLDLIEF